jgi:glycosyltransferase involved in cell wall biosynthesis
VIGSDTGVLPELIGSAGIVTPAGEAEPLAAAIGEIFDSEKRGALARAARARALELYSDDAVAERTVAFWQSLPRQKAR